MKMYKHLYKRFLEHNQGTLNFAAHSHHYWPDATRDAMLQYWDDTAKMVGDKWDHVFGTVVPDAQKYVAQYLDLPHPEQIVFCLLYTSPSPRDRTRSRMPSSA